MRTFCWTLCISVTLAFALAFYVGWISVSAERQDDKLVASLAINLGQVERDADRVEESGRKLGARARDQIDDLRGTETVMGVVNTVDEYGLRFTLAASDDRELTIRMDPTTRVSTARIRGMQVGDRVTVVLATQNDEHVARSVTIE